MPRVTGKREVNLTYAITKVKNRSYSSRNYMHLYFKSLQIEKENTTQTYRFGGSPENVSHTTSVT